MKTWRTIFIILGLFFFSTTFAEPPLTLIIQGIDQDNALENVKQTLSNQRDVLPTPLNRDDILAFKAKSYQFIEKALQPYGYFHATIRSSISKQYHHWTITYHIHPGKPILLNQVSVTISGPGKDSPYFQKLLHNLPIQRGQIFQLANYEKVKQRLLDIAAHKGYFKAKLLTSKVVVNLNTYQADIIIHFSTGSRFYFGKTTFTATPFYRSFLKRFLAYRQGEIYDNDKIQKTQQNLIAGGYFTQAVVMPLPDKAKGHQVPIKIILKVVKPRLYTLGLGYGTDTGVRGTLGFDWRYVNGYGHRFNALIQGSTINNSAQASYTIPGPHPATDAFSLSGAFGNISQSTGKSRYLKIAGSYITKWGLLNQTYSLNYLNERYNLSGQPRTTTNLIYPNLEWDLAIRSHELRPKYGISLSLSLAGAPKSLVFDKKAEGFFQAVTSIKTLYTFNPTQTRFLFRTRIGRTQIKNINNLPLSLQLFAGGATSIRGFSYNKIGPGKNLFVASIEIQQKVYGDFYLAGFYDVGNVTDNNPFDPKNLKQGVGPAIVWLSPVGAVTLSYGFAISEPKSPGKFQFSVGQPI